MSRRARVRGGRRPPRSALLARWSAVGALVLVAVFYFRPVRAYLETHRALAARQAEVRALRANRRALERRLAASTSTGALALEARRLGLVKPGEQLFIVKGIPGWRKRHRHYHR